MPSEVIMEDEVESLPSEPVKDGLLAIKDGSVHTTFNESPRNFAALPLLEGQERLTVLP